MTGDLKRVILAGDQDASNGEVVLPHLWRLSSGAHHQPTYPGRRKLALGYWCEDW